VKDKASKAFGKTILYTPTNDWVEDNFTEESLAIVQAVAEETNCVYPLKNSSKKEQGFVPLDKPLRYTVDQKDLQISKMQYVPPMEGRNAMGDVIELPESWHGLIIETRRGEETQQVTLDRDWVVENTDAPFRKFLEEIRIKDGHRGFLLIPEGDNEAHVDGSITFVSIMHHV
jgi:hypothetical protein